MMFYDAFTEACAVKKKFVCRELSHCVLASHPNVIRLEYHFGFEYMNSSECVTIRFSNGYLRRVPVTGDSLRQIALDVFRALEG